jgi:hypothetical protein
LVSKLAINAGEHDIGDITPSGSIHHALAVRLRAEMRAAMADLDRLREAYTLEAVQARTAAQMRYLLALHALQALAPNETIQETQPPENRME